MKRGRSFAAAALVLWGCGSLGGHGPAQDHSRFEGAALMQDRTVLVSFSHLVYRPAAGITAFPDGGVPRYLKDESVLAAYTIGSGALRVLRREPNKRWAAGQGRFGIQHAKGSIALLTQGGQLRSDLSKSVVLDWLVDVATGAVQPMAWRAALAERGRATSEIYLLDGRGTLLFVTTPLPAAAGAAGEGDVWLWLRTPGGEFVPVARTPHYEGMDGEDLVSWVPETRRFMAFNVVTHATRDLPGYRVPPPQEAVEGVSIEAGGRRLLLGRKGSDGWEYVPLPLEPESLK